MAQKIKKGDEVLVRAGAFRGHRGSVIDVVKDGAYVHVSQCTRIKHVRPNPERQVEGGRVQVPMPIHKSNVSLVDAEGRPVRVGFKQLEDGQKVRINRRTEETLDSNERG